MKEKKSFRKILFAQTAVLLVLIISGCNIADPEDVIQPGRLKVQLAYKYADTYTGGVSDALYVQARDFKIFNNGNFADVFQHPDQFLERSDSLVNFNLMEAALNDTPVQVAYGSLPPQEYDSLYFQVTPLHNVLFLDYNFYPITTDYNSIPIENDFSKVVKIRDRILIEENKTTTLVVEFKVEENIFRILDDFVFSAQVDTFYVLNE